MRIEITDFPSDPNGTFGPLRKVLMDALRKADTYPNNAKLMDEILKFAAKKLKDSKAEHAAKARVAKDTEI